MSKYTLDIKFNKNQKLDSTFIDNNRVGGVKWNDIDNGIEYSTTINLDYLLEQKDTRISELEKENNEFYEYNKKLLNEKRELEKELADLKKNAIVPRFKLGQEIYQIVSDEINGGYKIHKDVITAIEYVCCRLCYFTNYWGSSIPFGHRETELFTTKEEAEAELKELEGKV